MPIYQYTVPVELGRVLVQDIPFPADFGVFVDFLLELADSDVQSCQVVLPTGLRHCSSCAGLTCSNVRVPQHDFTSDDCFKRYSAHTQCSFNYRYLCVAATCNYHTLKRFTITFCVSRRIVRLAHRIHSLQPRRPTSRWSDRLADVILAFGKSWPSHSFDFFDSTGHITNPSYPHNQARTINGYPLFDREGHRASETRESQSSMVYTAKCASSKGFRRVPAVQHSPVCRLSIAPTRKYQ